LNQEKKSATFWTASTVVSWVLLGWYQTKIHRHHYSFNFSSADFWFSYFAFFPAAVVCIALTLGTVAKWYPHIKRWQKEKLLRLEKESAKHRQRGSKGH
jgi:hypothetical protein